MFENISSYKKDCIFFLLLPAINQFPLFYSLKSSERVLFVCTYLYFMPHLL